MAEKQLDKLVANAIHSLESYKLNRETLLLEFLRKDSAIDVAPSIVSIANGDSLPFLKSSVSPSTPRTINWINTVISNGRLVSIGGAEIRTDLSILNRNATTLDIASNTGDDVTIPAATVSLSGLMTAAGFTKLGTIETGADVTDKENVGAAILASPTKGTLAETDYLAILDSTGNILSKVIWSSVVVDGSVTINQASHGFSVGDPIKPSLTGWVLTKADSVANAGTVGVVSQVVNSGTFKYITSGVVPGSYTIGADYFLSTTSLGDLMIVTGSESWTLGQVTEYIGTGVAGGLHVNVEQGQEISSLLVVDKYVQSMAFDNLTRKLSLERTDGLATLEVTIPQYVEVDTLDSVLNRGNSSALGATFGNTVTASKLSVFSGYDIEKVGNKMILSTPLQFEVNINSTSVLQVATGGNVTAIGSVTTPTIKLTSGAVPDYVWRCTNVNGSGAWLPVSASNIYKGTWNATTNTPTLTNGIGTAGWYYRVTVAGTFNAVAYSVGDDVIYNGTVWERIPGTGFTLQPATASVLGGVKIGSGVTVAGDGTISVATNYQAPITGTGLVYSTGGVISYDTTVYASQTWVTTNFAAIGHNHSSLYVPLTRNINTSGSLTGGGSLSADRTLSLVGDSTSPGNFYVYGTNGSGTKGWQQTFWVPATGGTYYSGGYVAIGNLNPAAPLHIQYDVASGYASIVTNTNATTGNGIAVTASNIAFEVRDKANTSNPAFQIFGDGSIKWQLPTSAVNSSTLYYDPTTKQVSVGASPTLASLGGISLTSLSAASPISYDNTTGIFSMITNAYAPFGTVSFPGFGTSHSTAAYGDHTHAAYEITAGTTSQYWRGDKTFQELNTVAVVESTNLYFTTARSRTSISLTTTGTTGTASYNNTTGVLNIPNYSQSIYVNGVSFNTSTGVLTLTRLNSTDLTTSLDGRYSLTTHTHAYEPSLGLPGLDGWILSSTVAGVRSWITPYVHPFYSVRNIDATAGQVIDVFTSDSTGHVTNITLRTLVEADIPTLSIAKTTGLQTALDGKQPASVDLTAIAAISGSVGFLKRTGAGAWSIDTTSYLTGITRTMVVTALGYDPEPGLGNPSVTGYVLSSTTSGVRSWIAISGSAGGTVTSVAAGAGMNFATFTSTGTITMGTPSTITIGTLNSASGVTHSHVLDISGRSVSTQFSIAGGGNLGSDRMLYLVGDVASPGNGMLYGTDGAGVRGWYAAALNNYPTTLTFVAGTLTISRNGLTNLSVSIDGRYSLTNHTHATYLTDAPINGSYYARKDGGWYAFTPGSGSADGNNYTTAVSFDTATGTLTTSRSGIGNLTTAIDGRYSLLAHTHSIYLTDAPSNGNTYGRLNGVWSVITTSGLTDAPSDGSYYARKNGAWAVITTGSGADGNNYPTAMTLTGTTLYLSRNGLTDLSVSLSPLQITNHASLSNLSYAASGHTGFAPTNGTYTDYFQVERLRFSSSALWNLYGASSTFEFNYNNSLVASLTSSGVFTAQEVYRGSSRELKFNIVKYEGSAIDMLNSTEIFTYNMKRDSSFAIGFIAEDTHKWLSGEEQKRHSFGNHLGILTKAIQEEDNKITALQNEVNELKVKVKDLEDGRR